MPNIYYFWCPQGLTICHAMPTMSCRIPCHARQTMPFALPCPPGHNIYHVMHWQAMPHSMLCLARSYPILCYARQAIPYAMPCPLSHTIYHAMPWPPRYTIYQAMHSQAIPYTMTCPPSHSICHTMPIRPHTDHAMPTRLYHIQCHSSPDHTIYLIMPTRSYHISCHATANDYFGKSCHLSKGANGLVTRCTIAWKYHAMPTMPWGIPCHVRQARPYTIPCPPGHTIYQWIVPLRLPGHRECHIRHIVQIKSGKVLPPMQLTELHTGFIWVSGHAFWYICISKYPDMPARPYHMLYHAHQAIHLLCHAHPTIQYTMSCKPGHTIYHAIPRQTIPYTLSCRPGHTIYHAMPRSTTTSLSNQSHDASSSVTSANIGSLQAHHPLKLQISLKQNDQNLNV